MDELAKALYAAGTAFLGALTVAIGVLGTYAAKLLAARGEMLLAQLKQQASDVAVAAVEERTRSGASSAKGEAKVQEAIAIADAATPSHVSVKESDIHAGVTRLRASMPTPTSSAPPPIIFPSPVPPQPSGALRAPPTGFDEAPTRPERLR
jgi:hypothetical protein